MISDRSTILENAGADSANRGDHADLRLRLTVVYTTLEATLSALQSAGMLAKNLKGQIDLLAIEAVPHPLPFDRPPIPVWFYTRLMDALVSATDLDVDDVTTHVYLCRDRRQCLQRVLRPRSLVVLGGKRSWWSREKKLEQWVTSLGHRVVFVDVKHPSKLQELSARVVTFVGANGAI